ncbi:MAG: hypothetical protein H8E25_07510 [Planctomycetes bacterium]|nr:hypothetical protein [Planctomycetota bacterium]
MKLFPNHSCKNLAAAAIALASLFACGPGSSLDSSVENFGLASCSLGCKGQSFSITQHFENKDLTFTFNDSVDPASVDSSSLSIIGKTTGVQPTGTYLVRGNVVVFRPTLTQTIEGIRYGFERDATYRIDINGDNAVSVIESLKGRRNQSSMSGEINIDAAVDLNPGSPSLVSISPTSTDIPESRDFEIEIVFDDIMSTVPLANPETGEGNLVSVTSVDDSTGIEYEIPGFYSTYIDRDSLTTTLTFAPLVAYPSSNGGQRYLRVLVGSQVSDISLNDLLNAGTRQVMLLDVPEELLSLSEQFEDESQQDTAGSVYGLWQSNSYLNSGQAPDGSHHGGGSGALGLYAPESDDEILFKTSGFKPTFSSLFEQEVYIENGVYPYSEVILPGDNNATAEGANALSIIVQGDFSSQTKFILGGADAPQHTGKSFFGNPLDSNSGQSEREGDENTGVFLEPTYGSSIDETDPIFFGGDGAVGDLSAGNGGRGGDTWFANSIGFGNNDYLNTIQTMWAQFILTQATPNSGRYKAGKGPTDDRYSGSNGEGVGGELVLGAPNNAPDALATDLSNGSGMGSICWPPQSNEIMSGLEPKTHNDKGFIIHRARGGGGGGYWTNGQRGQYFVENSVNGLNQNMSLTGLVPEIVEAQNIFEYNSLENGDDVLYWDRNAAVPNQISDASGGQFSIPVGFESLDPTLSFLLGGSGGGGAGMGQHGSIEDRVSGAVAGDVNTWRCGAGGGGGAGGGAMQIFAGSNLSIDAAVECDGGNGATSEFVRSVPYSDPSVIEYGPPGDAGGGGGSGGAILLEAGRGIQIADDMIIVDGGLGGKGAVGNDGGKGGSGVVRFNTATGLETIDDLRTWVSPDVAVEKNPVLLNGIPNVGTIGSINYSGGFADVSFLSGEVINGNASGVRSRWYEPVSADPTAGDKLEIELLSYTIECEYSSDGINVETLTFGSASLTNPDTTSGATAVWVAFQGAWMAPGESANAQPNIISQTSWLVPGFTVADSGVAEFNQSYNRALRYMLVFDQDVIAGLLLGHPDSYFHVTGIDFNVSAR